MRLLYSKKVYFCVHNALTQDMYIKIKKEKSKRQ